MNSLLKNERHRRGDGRARWIALYTYIYICTVGFYCEHNLTLVVILVRLEPSPELGVGGRVPAAAAVHVGHAGVRGAGRQWAWNETKKHVQIQHTNYNTARDSNNIITP